MTVRLYAGIDGGQSSTTAVVADEHGVILGRASGGPVDYIDQPPESERAARTVDDVLTQALRAAGHGPAAEFASVVAGVSGYDGTPHGRPIAVRAPLFKIVHDAPVALAGAFAGGPGILVISGTGSVAYGQNERGESITAGGWGYLFGDEGSAFWIARRALSEAMSGESGGAEADLGTAACAFFGVDDLRALCRGFYTREIGRPQLASFTRVVCDAARLGDRIAANIIEAAAEALATLALQVARRLKFRGKAEVALVGGTFSNDHLRLQTQHKIVRMMPEARLTAPRFDPAVGALMLAYHEDNRLVPEPVERGVR